MSISSESFIAPHVAVIEYVLITNSIVPCKEKSHNPTTSINSIKG